MREGDICNTGICVHACCSVCDRDRGKRDPGASEDTGVSEMVGAWEKAGKRAERKELWWGDKLTFDPFHRLGSSNVQSASQCLLIV